MNIQVEIKCEQCEFTSNGMQQVENRKHAAAFSQTIVDIMRDHYDNSTHRQFVVFDRQINVHQWFLVKTFTTFVLEEAMI